MLGTGVPKLATPSLAHRDIPSQSSFYIDESMNNPGQEESGGDKLGWMNIFSRYHFNSANALN